MIHDTDSYTSLPLTIIPPRSQDWVTRQLDKAADFFDDRTGNALLVPTRDLPHAYQGEYPIVEGTMVGGYTPTLDVFFWQFARPWMGLPDEGKVYLAAPREHVWGALDDDIYLVDDPEGIMRALPDDCNLHWRSFFSAKQGPEEPEQTPWAQLVRFLQKSGVVMPETEADERLIDFCQRYSLPLSRKPGHIPCASLSATTFLWLAPQTNKHWVARLGTIFGCGYGIDLDD